MSPRFVLRTGLHVLLLCALRVPASAAGRQEDRSLHWREIAVEARLDADGRLRVRERQAIVFDGDWNGAEREFDVRFGQRLRLHGLSRIDAATGRRTALVQDDDLEEVDQFDWKGDETLRWRSRLPDDPPFRGREIVYELDYSLGPVLVPAEDGGYRLRHDFAFAEREGTIGSFRLELALDGVWTGPGSGVVTRSAEGLPPGLGFVVDLPLRYAGAGAPAAVPRAAAAPVRALAGAGALLVPLLVLGVLRRRTRELDRAAPPTPSGAITPAWLREHLFLLPAEVVGTAWDRSVGKAEVAALLARLVEEGRLASRVETGGRKPVLHLERLAPLDSFAAHERDLLEGFFFHGGDRTDTASIRKHYEKKGFDPAARIRKALEARLDALPGSAGVRRRWLPAAAVLLVGLLLTFGSGWAENTGAATIGLLTAMAVTAIAVSIASELSKRVIHRGAPTAGVLVPLLLGSLALAALAGGLLQGAFFRAGPLLLLGLLALLAGAGMLSGSLARSTETVDRLAFRRRLASAREFFEGELQRPEPRLEDAWFPYLLAFGLGPHVDRWFETFGPSRPAAVAAYAGSGGHQGSGWTGGGVQFGGGAWAGGGSGGAWGAAATDLAGGVSPPGSGGGASSGGGGGGGW